MIVYIDIFLITVLLLVLPVTLRSSNRVPERSSQIEIGKENDVLSSSPQNNQGDSLNVRLVGQYPTGPAFAVAVDEERDIVFVGSQDAIIVLDVSDPANPLWLSELSSQGWWKGVFYRDNYLYVADSPDFRVVSIVDPENPVVVGEINGLGSPQGVTVDDTVAYVSCDLTGGRGIVQIVSVSDPTNLKELGQYWPEQGTPWQIVIEDTLAYVASEWAGLKIISISDPSNTYEVGSYQVFNGWSLGVALSDSFAYLANGSDVKVISVGNPTNPIEVESYITPGSPADIITVGMQAYLADRFGGFRVLSIVNPTNLFELGYYQTVGEAWAVEYFEPYVYVATTEEGLMIFEYYDPTSIGDSDEQSLKHPKSFSLSQNYPNPFNPSTTIQYDIPVGNGTLAVKISVYDIRGRLVRKLINKEKEPGQYQVHWNGRDDMGQQVSSGVYLYRIDAGEYISTRKMVLYK